MRAWHSSQSSSNFSGDSSPSSRRHVCTECSKRFIATWRKTVAIESSILPASRLSRRRGSSSSARRRLNVSASPKTDAVSAVVSGVFALKSPSGCARYPWSPCPSSCASVSTERRSPVKFMNTYGCTSGTFVAQKAPGRFPSRGGASIQLSLKNCSTMSPGLGGEVRERAQDDLRRLVPPDLGRVVRERGHAVVEGEPLEPEQLRLQRVVALDDLVATDDGVDERLHRLVGRVVREVARRDPGRVAAQPVVDRAVDGDGVEDERARPEPRAERDGHGVGGTPSLVAVCRVELRHRLLEADLGAVEVDADRAEELVVEPVPGAEARDCLLREDLLLGLREDVRPELADGAKPVAPALERAARDQGVRLLVLERRQLEAEEQELRVDRGALLRQLRDERAARRSRPCPSRTTGARSRSPA